MKLIKDESQFVILQEGAHLSVTMDQVQQQVAPLALAPDYQAGTGGSPGLMYPGPGLDYNSVTGEVSAYVPYVPTYMGLVGSDVDTMVQKPTGREKPNEYYIAAEPDFELDNNWGELKTQTPFLGDKVVKGDEYKGQPGWFIIPSITGSQGLLDVRSNTDALKIDRVDDPQRPILTIEDVVPYVDAANPGQSGLMPPDAMEEFEAINLLYLRRDFDRYDNIDSAP